MLVLLCAGETALVHYWPVWYWWQFVLWWVGHARLKYITTKNNSKWELLQYKYQDYEWSGERCGGICMVEVVALTVWCWLTLVQIEDHVVKHFFPHFHYIQKAILEVIKLLNWSSDGLKRLIHYWQKKPSCEQGSSSAVIENSRDNSLRIWNTLPTDLLLPVQRAVFVSSDQQDTCGAPHSHTWLMFTFTVCMAMKKHRTYAF